MITKIKLKSGYNPDKYRDELCAIGKKIRKTMSRREYLIYINEIARKSPLFRKFENEDVALKPETKE